MNTWKKKDLNCIFFWINLQIVCFWRKICRKIRRYVNPDIIAKAFNLFVVSIDYQFSAHIRVFACCLQNDWRPSPFLSLFLGRLTPHHQFFYRFVLLPFSNTWNATNKKCEKLNNLRLKSDFPKRRWKKENVWIEFFFESIRFLLFFFLVFQHTPLISIWKL